MQGLRVQSRIKSALRTFGGGCLMVENVRRWQQRKAHDLKIADGVAPRLSEIFSGGHGAVTVAKIEIFFIFFQRMLAPPERAARAHTLRLTAYRYYIRYAG
jgi:hypothetical protein